MGVLIEAIEDILYRYFGVSSEPSEVQLATEEIIDAIREHILK